MFHLLLPVIAALAPNGEATIDRDTEWMSLDRELEALATSSQAPANGIRIWGYIRTAYSHGDVDVDNDGIEDAGETDVGGFRLLQVRPYFVMTQGDFTTTISLENNNGTARLFHAFSSWKLKNGIKVSFGRFKQPFLRTFMLSDEKTVLVERTNTAATTGRFDIGAMIDGLCMEDRIHYWLAVQNGDDGLQDEFFITGKIAWTPIGQEVPMAEGALVARDEPDLTVALMARDDGTYDNGTSIGVEAVFNKRPFSVQADIVDLDDDVGDRTPLSATVGYLLQPQWELIARYDDTDNVFDTNRITLGANYYVQGHEIKWQFNVGQNDADTGGSDGGFAQAGLVVTF